MSLVCFTSSMPCFNPVSRQRHESLQHNFLDKCQGGPPCCHGASPLSTPLHRKTTRKPRPLPHRTRCGVVPNAAHRWPLSNDSQPHNSNFDLRRFWPRPHEITHPHTAGVKEKLCLRKEKNRQ